MTWFRLGSIAAPDRDLMGGKAFSVNAMLALGLPVPPAFALGTDECLDYFERGRVLSPHVRLALREGIREIEEQLGRTFGGSTRPLLVSVRSGAARSMPGMMDTVLNLGVNDDVVRALRRESSDAGHAEDTRGRFLDQFRKVVGREPTEDPWDQLEAAVSAVFESWHSPRAAAYRAHHGLSDEGGTAVTLQAMVFGNADEQSGTGVLFTRNPVEARREPFGEWLPRAQGEDVVSGRATPLALGELAVAMPNVYDRLMEAASVLEHVYADIQDIEFTIESGHLWLLQTRSAKRSARAAVHHAVAFALEGVISADDALARLSVEQLRGVLSPHVSAATRANATVLARGEVGCPGVARGLVVGTADGAEDLANEGRDVILARPTTDPDDVHGMIAARAVITEIGGATSHAAVVSRELDRPCIVGCGAETLMSLVGRQVTVDATSGEVLDGMLEIVVPTAAGNPDLAVVWDWVSDQSRAGHPFIGLLSGAAV